MNLFNLALLKQLKVDQYPNVLVQIQ